MTFVSLLIALLADRYLSNGPDLRNLRWFDNYLHSLARQPYGLWASSRYWGATLVLLPPLLLVALLQSQIPFLAGGVLYFLFATMVLLYCLGAADLDSKVHHFIQEQEHGDPQKVLELASGLCQCSASDQAEQRIEQVTDGIFAQANQRLFAVILWFLLLGPLGAALYRLARAIPCAPQQEQAYQAFEQGRQRLLYILEWLPARLCAAAFALTGNFERVLEVWRTNTEEGMDQGDNETHGLLVRCGRAALLLPGAGEDTPGVEQIEATLSLIWRALAVWMLVIALLLLAF